MVDAVDVFPYFSPTKKELNFLAKLYVINEKQRQEQHRDGGGDHLHQSLRVGCCESAAVTRVGIVATATAYAAQSACGNGGWNFKNNLEQRTAA